jgi:serine protein kinase
MSNGKAIVEMVQELQDKKSYLDLTWEGRFEYYLEIVLKNPHVTRTAFQRLYDMILSYGFDEYTEARKKMVRYKFFSESEFAGPDAIYGLESSIMQMVNCFKAAAHEYGTERRVLLLHGPVGSSKSTIVRLMKKGLEEYSKTDAGALYTFSWEVEDIDGRVSHQNCPMHEEPLHLVPRESRTNVMKKINDSTNNGLPVQIRGDLCPFCRYIYRDLNKKYNGDWDRILSHVHVKRLVLSEQDRIGIGTFEPKDEKNQDSTELTGDINYRKIAVIGVESDPRAFNFDGEFNIANRGMVEFIEVLKLDVAFLYDLLGASQEHKIKPKKFSQTDIDEVIIGHTNEPEYRKLENNEFMEALRDRTIKIDVPYITRLNDEVKIYQKDYNPEKIQGKHIAPHTIEVAAMWAILTRLEEPKKAGLTLLQKLKLYNGKSLPGFTEDNVKELQKEAKQEGMNGISPRYIQDKIANALVADMDGKCVNPFMVLNELEEGLEHNSLITSEDLRRHARELMTVVKEEYENMVKHEVQRAISADDEALGRLCSNYIDNIKAYTQKEKVSNRYTGQDEEPNERLMRSIEEKIDIPENRKDDFRREIMNFIGALAIEDKSFDYKTNERLLKALELKLFEDQKDTIKLTSLVSNVVDKETQEKIDVVKDRLIRDMGYCETCATDILHFVASIFARGDSRDE